MDLQAYSDIYRDDPYFQKEYIECYLEEGDALFEFEERQGDDFFLFRSIKRPIKEVGSETIQESLFDLESVYGYGGYVTNSSSESFLKRAMERLQDRCREEQVVAHFMRFHPLNTFPQRWSVQLDFCAVNRKTVFVDVHQRNYDEVRTGYSSSLKRNINKAGRKGLLVKEEKPTAERMSLFQEMYYETMRRKGAEQMYFFGDDYFHKLRQLRSIRLFVTYLDEQVISMILCLCSPEGHVYYHLGATHGDYYSYNPNPLIMDHIVQTIVQEGGRFLFLGGGNSDNEDDPLFRFKKKFSDDFRDFYIGGQVFDQKRYEQLRQLAHDQNPALKGLFLLYRFV